MCVCVCETCSTKWTNVQNVPREMKFWQPTLKRYTYMHTQFGAVCWFYCVNISCFSTVVRWPVHMRYLLIRVRDVKMRTPIQSAPRTRTSLVTCVEWLKIAFASIFRIRRTRAYFIIKFVRFSSVYVRRYLLIFPCHRENVEIFNLQVLIICDLISAPLCVVRKSARSYF